MMELINLLKESEAVSEYKINIEEKQSYEMFFVKGSLETVRATDTVDKQVTVYVNHGDFKGDSSFFVYPSNTPEQIREMVSDAAAKAALINNKFYTLPEKEEGEYEVESNFADYKPEELGALIANTVFEANTLKNGSLNSVEVFVNKRKETVINSNGLRKTQTKYDAMVEAIPTFNGERESVELYEQYNFSSFNQAELKDEIYSKMQQVKARYEAVKPDFTLNCDVVLNKSELNQLFKNIVMDLNFASVYQKANVHKIGDRVQSDGECDAITLSVLGELKGSTASSRFDTDGLALLSVTLVEDGLALNYHGSNRYGQYLDLKPTGNMRCISVKPGSVDSCELSDKEYLEVVSMSGLQVDFYSDYIGGEIRLAYYHKDGNTIPLTALSFTGSLKKALDGMRLTKELTTSGGYFGPAQAILKGMSIF